MSSRPVTFLGAAVHLAGVAALAAALVVATVAVARPSAAAAEVRRGTAFANVSVTPNGAIVVATGHHRQRLGTDARFRGRTLASVLGGGAFRVVDGWTEGGSGTMADGRPAAEHRTVVIHWTLLSLAALVAMALPLALPSTRKRLLAAYAAVWQGMRSLVPGSARRTRGFDVLTNDGNQSP
ncbi:MAG TPA: hypothetical protein VK324_06325 [Tepidisphaeraceae bacterium]|nr:hypothetical protein [Tepidisphaeraceae bacterium]